MKSHPSLFFVFTALIVLPPIAMAQSLPSPSDKRLAVADNSNIDSGQINSGPLPADRFGFAPGPILSTKAALTSATMVPTAAVVFVQRYSTSSVSALARWTKQTSCPSKPQAWDAQSADGSCWQLDESVVSVTMLGAVGNNSTDDAAAFNNAFAYAAAKRRKVYIPRGNYVLGSQISTNFPIDLVSDVSADIRFTNSSSCGFLFDLRANSFGLNSVSLPNLFAPVVNSAYQITGYGPTVFNYDLTARSCDAVHIIAGSRMHYDINYLAGFAKGFNIESSYDAIYGAKTVDNLDLGINTADFTDKAFYFNPGPARAGGIHAVRANANTIWAKYPFYFDVTSNTVSQLTGTIGGQAIINEPGGAGIYANGNNVNTSVLNINWLYAGHSADSTTGVSSTLTIPYLAGSASSNSQIIDGNATVGYFGGFRNKISIGIAFDLAGKPGGSVPARGVVTRIRDAGSYNSVGVKFFDQYNSTPIALSTSATEASYNGGVGSASMSQKTYYSATVPSLAARKSATFYFFNQLLSANSIRPVEVIPIDSGIAASGLLVNASDKASSGVNRQGTVTFTNPTSSTIAGATYYFFVEVKN